MLDEELVVRAVEALRVCAALILQAGQAPAVQRLPEGQGERTRLVGEIALASRDAAVLADACAVLLRRGRA